METGVELIVNVADALPLGLKVHAGERDATLKRLMKQSGTAQIQRGSKIQLCTYPPQEIERLLANPEIIAAWRQGDFEQF